MARGRKPKPTQLKVVQGTFRPERSSGSEPEPDRLEDITPPGWLDEVARERWKYHAPKLSALRVLTEVDVDALAAYCTMYSRWQAAEKAIESEGIQYESEPGVGGRMLRKNPAVGTAAEALRLMLSYGAVLGLNPGDRGKLKTSSGQTSNGKKEKAGRLLR